MKTICVLYLLLASWIQASPATESTMDEFVSAIHMVETSGRHGAHRGDRGKALGPLQIHREYWKDAVEFDSTLGGRYEDCQHLGYSRRVMTAYFKRYAADALAQSKWDVLAKTHHAGPDAASGTKANGYWRRVKTILLGYAQTKTQKTKRV